jgi:hypothetical protein
VEKRGFRNKWRQSLLAFDVMATNLTRAGICLLKGSAEHYCKLLALRWLRVLTG